MWVRGLKPSEIRVLCFLPVAPHVGAWIETCRTLASAADGRSHPMWVRGLKHHVDVGLDLPCWSHPMWVRGLKRSHLCNL